MVAGAFWLQVHVTDKCNLRCKHCYTLKSKKELSKEQFATIIDKYLEVMKQWNRLPVIALSGGEPLLAQGFFDYLDYIENRSQNYDMRIHIQTNGTLITNEKAICLSKYAALKLVQVSLDGITASTHDKIRGRGAFKKALEGIKNLKKAGIFTTISFTVLKSNWREALELHDFANTLGVDWAGIGRFVPIGEGHQIKDQILTPEEIKTLYQSLIEIEQELHENKKRGAMNTEIEMSRCDWPILYTGNYSNLLRRNRGGCGAGLNCLTVMPDGSTYPCRRLPMLLGNLIQEDFIDIWMNKWNWMLRFKNIFMKGKCQICKFNTDPRLNHLCSGGATCISYAYYHDPFMPDPQCWVDPVTDIED